MELPVRDAAVFRSLGAACANYLGWDRRDGPYSAKELCRGMASPTVGDMNKLKRSG